MRKPPNRTLLDPIVDLCLSALCHILGHTMKFHLDATFESKTHIQKSKPTSRIGEKYWPKDIFIGVLISIQHIICSDLGKEESAWFVAWKLTHFSFTHYWSAWNGISKPQSSNMQPRRPWNTRVISGLSSTAAIPLSFWSSKTWIFPWTWNTLLLGTLNILTDIWFQI